MSGPRGDLAERRGDYGFDAPYVPAMLAAGGVVLVVLGVRAGGRTPLLATLTLTSGAMMLLSTLSYIYTTRRGKHAVWAELLSGLGLRGDERVLDVGCGRGAVLLMAARLLPRGQAVGLDLWRSVDQSGNDIEATRRNAGLEGVAERVDLRTGDMTAMPFEDDSFNVVLSSVAIHNVPQAEGRRKAIDEAVRVLRPAGRLVVADIRCTDDYEARLNQLGLDEVAHRSLGWRYWYGGPWMATSVVTARKRG